MQPGSSANLQRDVQWWAGVATIIGVVIAVGAWLWPDPLGSGGGAAHATAIIAPEATIIAPEATRSATTAEISTVPTEGAIDPGLQEYVNKTYNFSVHFPASWQGGYETAKGDGAFLLVGAGGDGRVEVYAYESGINYDRIEGEPLIIASGQQGYYHVYNSEGRMKCELIVEGYKNEPINYVLKADMSPETYQHYAEEIRAAAASLTID